MCQEMFSWMFRDQRTVKVPQAEQSGNRHSNTFVKELLAVSVCLVLFVPVGVMSAPARRDSPDSEPMWKNACGGRKTDIEPMPKSDEEILFGINTASRRALEGAHTIRDHFVPQTLDLAYLHAKDSYGWLHYPWLPSRKDVPKEVDEDVPDEHLQKLELNDFLKKSNKYLQILSVALEQVYKDMKNDGHRFAGDFKKFLYNLSEVMCEVQSAIYIRKLDPEVPNIDVEATTSGESQKALRNWIIFREYMNILEYVIGSSSYLMEQGSGS